MSPTPSDVDPAEHQVTLNLLFEAADYLGRLPANALTRELKAKIDAHLQRPGAAVHKERIAAAAEDRNWSERLNAGGALTGSSQLTPGELPLVQCLVVQGTVHLRSPAIADAQSLGDAHAPRLASAIGRELATGMKQVLRPVNADNVLDQRLLKGWSPAAKRSDV